MHRLFLTLAFLTSLLTLSSNVHAKDAVVQLYRLDCGSIHVSDLNVFSDTYAYVGQEKQLVSSCYLIKHGDEWMLWDTGLPMSFHDAAEGVSKGPFTMKLETTIPQQLPALNISAEDIDYLAVSHTHFDHAGSASLFTNAKLMVQQAELDLFSDKPEKAEQHHMSYDSIKYFVEHGEGEQLIPLKGDYDVFGDGSVIILSAPGHTPGHQALLVNLENKGPVVLSGDQWHFIENYESNGVPSFNYDRTDTLASSDRLKAIVHNLRADLIIQHEPKHVEKIPAFPAFLD